MNPIRRNSARSALPGRIPNTALNRHRGKGQQKVTVEHVHVHSFMARR
jgi:hypothetical protein